jgi:2-haloacid dehalogenase
MTNGVTTVVFDLGGVLIDWNPRHLYRKLIADEAAIEDFLATVCTGDWNLEHDAGRPFADGIAERSAQFPDKADLIRAYFERHPEMIAGAIDGTVALLERLHEADVPVFALTNWSAETFAIERPMFPFLERFRDIVVSGVEKVIKPDPAIYRLSCARGGFAPQQAVFIDDSEKNVVGARNFGMAGIHFRSPAQLRGELAALGFPV